MKSLLLISFIFLVKMTSAQSLDYISVRKQSGRAVKNIYAGSNVIVQLQTGQYLQGPVKTVKNDSLFVTLYDIRYYQTNWGTLVKDTINTTTAGVHYKEIKRVQLDQRRGFFQRASGPLLMIGGAGYLTLNVLNGALFDLPITDKENLRRIGTAAGAFGLGFLLKKLFASDGFSKQKHQIVYIDL